MTTITELHHRTGRLAGAAWAAWAAGALSITVATLGALLVWALADPLAGVDLAVRSGSSTQVIGPGAVVVTGIVVGLAAVGVCRLVARARRPRRAWLGLSLTVLVISLAGPLGARTAGAGAALAAMHLVVGAILILGLGRTLAPESASPARREEAR